VFLHRPILHLKLVGEMEFESRILPLALRERGAGGEGAFQQPDDPTGTPLPSRTPTRTPRATESPAEDATDEAGGAASGAATPTLVPATVAAPPPSPGYRDERWYATTLGILVSAAIIALGALFNIGRGLLRRR
jgi:hypothetical protein